MIPATFANKHQPGIGAVAFRAVTATGASLAGVVRVNLHDETAMQRRFVGQESQQLSVAPSRTAAIGLPLLLRTVRAAASFGTLMHSGQFFDADKGVGIGFEDFRSERAIGVSNEPSFGSCLEL